MMLEGTHADALGSTGRPHFCRGEHRSPAGFCTAAKLHGRTMFAPTALVWLPPYNQPCNFTLRKMPTGGYRIRPYANMILAPEGLMRRATEKR